MKKIGRIGTEILEELSDGNIHIRKDMLHNQKRLLRTNEEPHIEIKFSYALSRLVNLNYIEKESRGKYRITPVGSKIVQQNKDELYSKIEEYTKVSEKNAKLAYEIFQKANTKFLKRKIKSIKLDVAEENLCSELSKDLENALREKNIRGYYAEANYNRNDCWTKTIINDDYKIMRIECDLIVHSMGENKTQDNLLAIEMKKHKNLQDREENEKRLQIVTRNTYNGEVIYEEFPRHICRYALGVFYDIDNDKNKLELKFYKHGKIEWKEEIQFNEKGEITKRKKIENKLEMY